MRVTMQFNSPPIPEEMGDDYPMGITGYLNDVATALPDRFLAWALGQGARLAPGVKNIPVQRRIRVVEYPMKPGTSLLEEPEQARKAFEYQLWCEADFDVDNCIPDIDVHVMHPPGACVVWAR